VQLPFVQPTPPPNPVPPAPAAIALARAQAIEPARQVTAGRAGGETTGKKGGRTGVGGSETEAASPRRRTGRGQLLDVFV